MSVHRVMGLETEYGISVPGRPDMHAVEASTRVVTAYARSALPDLLLRPRWDYERESPLRDARGFDLTRSDADASLLTDDPGMANAVLTSGARLYVDHAHPEYATPEVTNPLDAVRWDRAGMMIMARATQLTTLDGTPVHLYKNNTDNKGASYGTHENYLVARSVPFEELVRHLTPFFVTRQVITGSGRVGRGQDGRHTGFQLSQRADFFETEVGLETTFRRPIINTRDEPHADPEKYRRLHVIVGDANLADVANYLKLGTTSLVLAMIEQGALRGVDLSPVNPVRDMHLVSHDPTLRHQLDLGGGRRMHALDIQRELCERAHGFVSRTGTDDRQTTDVLQRWGSLLDRLAADPQECATELDWAAKLALLQGFRTRDGLGWDAARLQAIDLQYSDVRPDKGLWARLEAHGRLERLVSDDDVAMAVGAPPEDTRAYFRGECLRRYPESIAAASWDSVVFDVPGSEALVRIPTPDPRRGTKSQVEDLLAHAPDAAALVKSLTS